MDLIVNLAPTGMIPTKQMTPHVPVSPSEVIEDVLECTRMGVTVVHLHARDQDGAPTYRKQVYAEMISALRAQCPELVLGVSCSGRDFSTFEKRSEVLELSADLRPDMASLTLSSLNFARSASVNSPQMVQKLALKMKYQGIKPELEVFDLGMINYAKYLIDKKVLEPPYYFNLLVGNIAGAQPDLLHIAAMLNTLPENSYWSLAGIGHCQFQVNSLAIAFGGGVRIGIEDNIWFDQNREIQAKNSQILGRALEVAKLHNRQTMTSAQFRKLLALRQVT